MSDDVRELEADVAPSKARRRLASVGWLLSIAVLLIVMTGLLVRVRDGEGIGQKIAASLATGKRPLAPALPTADLAGDGAPGLPDWYIDRARDSTAGGGAPPDADVLVVNYWASWCGPCRDEAPELREIADDYADRGVTVVGVNGEDAASDARSFVREFKIDYPIVRASRSDQEAWGVRGFPETYIVGRDGRISEKVDGPIDADDLRAILDHELQRAPRG